MQKVIVIGAGIVGLSCAWAAQQRGFEVTLIDRDFEGDRASHGNAGGIAVSECLPLSLAGLGLKPLKWLVDPLGPLSIRPAHAPQLWPWFNALRKVARPENYERIATALAKINALCLPDFEHLMADIGLAHTVHKRGALTVYESRHTYQQEKNDWDLKRKLGVQFYEVSKAQIKDLEPQLAPVFERGVMFEDWAHIDDPKQVVTALREHLRRLGVRFVSAEAVALTQKGDHQVAVVCKDGSSVAGNKAVVAAGAWSERLASSVGDRVLLESERGYNTTLPASAGQLSREVIFAERKFVATPLSVGLRIGGAAEFAGLSAKPNYQRSAALLQLAKRFMPNLNETDARQWMGQRPTTPDSLPVIGASPQAPRVFYAFGHGHLGLTQSATTGQLVGDLLMDKRQRIDLTAFSIDRFKR